jgi:hypothetical protein
MDKEPVMDPWTPWTHGQRTRGVMAMEEHRGPAGAPSDQNKVALGNMVTGSLPGCRLGRDWVFTCIAWHSIYLKPVRQRGP